MRIVVAGTGGVGGYFGGLLARAGHAVTFLARGVHLEAIRRQGLVIHSVHGDFTLHPANATDVVATLAPPEIVLVAVKHHDLEAVSRQLAPIVTEQTVVVPLLNGIDAHRLLSRSLARGTIVGGTCGIAARIEAPGVIRQESQLRRVVVGALDGRPLAALEELVTAWRACGVEARQSADILADLWSKFVFIASFGGVTALARATAGEVRAEPATRALLIAAMAEVEVVGRASGVRLAEDIVARSMALVDGFEPGVTSSLQRDVADGRRFELEAFSGTVVRLAQEHGLDAPAHAAMYALLKPMSTRTGMHGTPA
jgi:2-dehydropantoate 2-reductase